MPMIGETRKARELGYKGSGRYIWASCEICGKERWGMLFRGRPKRKQCRSCANKQRFVSTETRTKLSAIHKGHTTSENTRAKIGLAHRGRIHSIEARINMSIGSKGRIITEETKAKLSKIFKGRILSEETKTKISIALKGQKGLRGDQSPSWKGGNVEAKCLECGKSFFVQLCRLKKGKVKYCSQTCKLVYQRKQGIFSLKPNKPEQILINLFEKDNLPFKYVGAGEVWFGNRNPDFINTNGAKQVIELLGTYWHPLFDGANRIEHYKQYGFDCLIIWEDELEDTKKIIKKVEKFIKF